MTVQLKSARHGASKAVLKAALNEAPADVVFEDPSIFNPRRFTGEDIQVGERFPVVMDPATRRRFATVERSALGFAVR